MEALSNKSDEKIYLRIHNDWLLDRTSVKSPHMELIVGQPGAGKSTIISLIIGNFDTDEEPVIVNLDEIRKYHPSYENIFRARPFELALHTQGDSWRWTKRLLRDARRARNHVIYETTLRYLDPTINIIQSFLAEDYTFNLHALAVHERKSILGIYARYERDLKNTGIARWIPLDFHDQTYAVYPDNVHRLETGENPEKTLVYRRGGGILYSSDSRTIETPYAKAAILAERNRIWTPEEKANLAREWQYVADAITARGGEKPDWYVAQAKRYEQSALLFASQP